MPTNSENLHGGDLPKCTQALLLIDVINDLEFPEGKQLLQFAEPMARKIAALKIRAKSAGVPVIYLNDNFGRWRSDFAAQVDHCLHDGVLGQKLAEILRPEQDDYFVLKPKHSGFYSSVLDVLLENLGVQTVILAGIAGNICVLFTANDAYMRDFRVIIPRDCIASNSAEENEYALKVMREILKADIRTSESVNFAS